MKRSIFFFLFTIACLTIGVMVFAVAYGSVQNSTSGNMTLDCVRMFYSDTWNKGYVEDLAKFCSSR